MMVLLPLRYLSPHRFISIGAIPHDVISLGLVPMGVVSVGLVSMGLLSIGSVSVVLMSIGKTIMSIVLPHEHQQMSPESDMNHEGHMSY